MQHTRWHSFRGSLHLSHGRAVKHNWSVELLDDFDEFVDEEGGTPELLKTGEYTFNDDHSYTHVEDIDEEPVRSGDVYRKGFK